jgi:hypothetical protein
MKHKHSIIMLLIGWLIAAFFPPQALLGMVKGKA